MDGTLVFMMNNGVLGLMAGSGVVEMAFELSIFLNTFPERDDFVVGERVLHKQVSRGLSNSPEVRWADGGSHVFVRSLAHSPCINAEITSNTHHTTGFRKPHVQAKARTASVQQSKLHHGVAGEQIHR